jgi:putative superfamily III holin-X
MLTRAAERVADHARRMVQLELELAKLEVQRKAASLGVGVGLVVTAGVLGLFGLGFLLATIAAALALVVDWWLALLIVAGALLIVAAGLAFGGLAAIKKGAPPVPEQAIAEAKLTAETLKNGNG